MLPFRQMCAGKKKKILDVSMVAKSWQNSPFYFEAKSFRIRPVLGTFRAGKEEQAFIENWPGGCAGGEKKDK
jgi:hypothetical protein